MASSIAAALAANATIGSETVAAANTALRIKNALDGVLYASVLEQAAVQVANVTALAGLEYPIDLAAQGAVSQLNVTAPADAANAVFAFYDATASATSTRVIRCTFSGSKLHGVSNDYAEINSAYGYIVIKYVNATIGWRVEMSR